MLSLSSHIEQDCFLFENGLSHATCHTIRSVWISTVGNPNVELCFQFYTFFCEPNVLLSDPSVLLSEDFYCSRVVLGCFYHWLLIVKHPDEEGSC